MFVAVGDNREPPRQPKRLPPLLRKEGSLDLSPAFPYGSIEDLIRRMDEDSRRARAMLAAAPDAFPKLGRLSG